MAAFVYWYNNEHLHSAIRFVTPTDRHSGRDLEVLGRRKRVYDQARVRPPNDGAAMIRNWEPIKEVVLNPDAVRMRQTG